MRITLTALVFFIGLALGLVSYFVMAAPLGTPTDEGFSNPTVPFAATIFILAIILVFLSPVVYELLPDSDQEPDTSETQG
jgi:H+/Cl- antiporter ClcA